MNIYNYIYIYIEQKYQINRKTMDQNIVSGNKPSPVALKQNKAIVCIKMFETTTHY